VVPMPIPPSDLAVTPLSVRPVPTTTPNIHQLQELPPPDAPQPVGPAPEPEPDERLRALRERIDALIDRLSHRRDSEEKSPRKPCDNAEELRKDVEQALADCGYGRGDIAPIAEAAIDLVDVALLDEAASGQEEAPAGPVYRLRAFEIAIAMGGADTDRTFRAGIARAGSAPLGGGHRRAVPDAGSALNDPPTGEAAAARTSPTEIPQRKMKRVALRGARRSLLPSGGEIVRLRFSAVTA